MQPRRTSKGAIERSRGATSSATRVRAVSGDTLRGQQGPSGDNPEAMHCTASDQAQEGVSAGGMWR